MALLTPLIVIAVLLAPVALLVTRVAAGRSESRCGPERAYVRPSQTAIAWGPWLRRAASRLVLGIWTLSETLAFLYSDLAASYRCDDVCNDPYDPSVATPGWWHWPDAWQWSALWITPTLALVATIAAIALYAKRRKRPARLALAASGIAAIGWLALVATA